MDCGTVSVCVCVRVFEGGGGGCVWILQDNLVLTTELIM